jgi:hypothetical protein
MHPSAYLIGAVLAVAIGGMATITGLDRDRAFYPTIMMVIALLYVLFAVMGGSADALLAEAAVAVVFLILALVGFRHSLWLVAFALAAHGIYDAVHAWLFTNPGAPVWWPAFCATYDLVAAGYLAALLTRPGRSAVIA